MDGEGPPRRSYQKATAPRSPLQDSRAQSNSLESSIHYISCRKKANTLIASALLESSDRGHLLQERQLRRAFQEQVVRRDRRIENWKTLHQVSKSTLSVTTRCIATSLNLFPTYCKEGNKKPLNGKRALSRISRASRPKRSQD